MRALKNVLDIYNTNITSVLHWDIETENKARM